MKKQFAYIAMSSAAVLLCAGILLAERMPQRAPESSSYSDLSLQPLISRDTLPLQVDITLDATTTSYRYEPQLQELRAVHYEASLPFDQNKLEQLFTSMSNLSSRSTVEAAPTDLSVYGLDKPAAVVKALYGKDQSHTVRIGNSSPLGDGFYGMLDGRPEVYLLLSYDVDSFLSTPYDFRVPVLLPELGAEESEYAAELMELVLQRKEGETLALMRQESGFLWITEPVSVESDQYLFTEQVVKGLFALMRTTPVIEEDTPQNLSRFGLDSPDTLYLRDGHQQFKLLIGHSFNGRTYLMREGIPSVLSVNSSLLSFFTIGYEQIMNRLYWIHNINDVKLLRVEVEGRTHTLDTSQSAAGLLLMDGQAVPEEAGRRLFSAAISTRIEQQLTPEQQLTDSSCRLSAVYKDGTEHTLAFFPLNERYVALSRNGAPQKFYCSSKDLQKIIEALEELI